MAPRRPPILVPHVFGLIKGNRACRYKTFTDLPDFMLLIIIPYIHCNQPSLLNFRLTLRKFNNILNEHENTLVPAILNRQIKPEQLAIFPALRVTTYQSLRTLFSRLQSLHDPHPGWLHIGHCQGEAWRDPELGLDVRRSVYITGLLLLYRLHDATAAVNNPRIAKINLIRTLPATSLACIAFTLFATVGLMQAYGPSPINTAIGSEDATVRQDGSMAFEEVMLSEGPDVLFAMLRDQERKNEFLLLNYGKRQWEPPAAAKYAYNAFAAQLRAVQGARLPKGSIPLPIVIALREALVMPAQRPLNDFTTVMFQTMKVEGFRDLGRLAKMARVVAGEIV